jgi:hypothetical protein
MKDRFAHGPLSRRDERPAQWGEQTVGRIIPPESELLFNPPQIEHACLLLALED